MTGWDYSNFTKGETFLVSLKLSAIWGNLTSHYSCLLLPKKSSFLQFGQAENVHAGGRIQDCCNIQDGAKLLAIITKRSILNVEAVQIRLWYGHLLEKIFLVCFSPLSPLSYLHMYVSKNFTKAKKSAICSEYTMRSKFHLSKWKTYFSKFIDKYLTIEEVEYLIHYVKFKM